MEKVEHMSEPDRPSQPLVLSLAALTVVTGIVDAVSYLGLGHVFTANMTGNIVLMEFRLGGDSGISLARSVLALCCFMLGALVVGRMGRRLDLRQLRISALLMEAAVLFVAAAIYFMTRGSS